MMNVAVHGWPERPDRNLLRPALLQLGRLFGWIDDVCDLLQDSGRFRWNLVSLFVAERTPVLLKIPKNQWRDLLLSRISEESIADLLVLQGRDDFRKVQRLFGSPEMDGARIIRMTADAALSWMAPTDS